MQAWLDLAESFSNDIKIENPLKLKLILFCLRQGKGEFRGMFGKLKGLLTCFKNQLKCVGTTTNKKLQCLRYIFSPLTVFLLLPLQRNNNRFFKMCFLPQNTNC